jgi:chromosome segregation ATPase
MHQLQKKDMQHAQYEAQLEKSLKDLHRQKEIALSESMSQLSSVERKLSTALAEKEKVVSGLQHKITILQNELQTQRSNSESNKRQHSSIVEVLKSDIAMAQQMREESVSSMQKNFDESMAHFKSEVENLHSQLSDAKIRADDDRKVWEQNSKSQYERSLNSMRDANDSLLQQLTLAQEEVEDLHSQLRNVKTSLDKENGTLIEQLTLAKRDIDMIKAARDKDVLLLESELAKTRQEKKSIESEFEDVRQKLDIALSSMNAMALDGAKKQNDLESVLDNFTSETNRYQEDIDQMRKEMRKVIEEQQVQIVNLQREKEQHERDCTMLHKDISSLEKEVATRDQIINDITNGTNHYQDEIDQMRKFNEEQLGRLRNLQRDNEQNERDCIMLHKDVSSLKEEVLTRDQIINSLTNEKNRNQDDIDQMRKVNEEQLGRLRNLQSEQEQHEHDCTMLRKDISSLEEEVSTRDQIINNLTNETSRYQDEIDQMRKVNEEQLGRLRNLQREKEQYEHDCTMLHKDVSSLEEEVSTRDQIINNLTNENNRYQDEIDRTRKVNEEQLGRLRNLQGEKEHYEYECIMLRKNISSLEELEAAQSEVVECRTRTSVLEAEKDKLSTEVCRHLESLEQLRSVQREKSMELKRAQQTIQVLKSKERYLESRVDSLADQISKTVRDYEMRLQSSSSGEGSDC